MRLGRLLSVGAGPIKRSVYFNVPFMSVLEHRYSRYYFGLYDILLRFQVCCVGSNGTILRSHSSNGLMVFGTMSSDGTIPTPLCHEYKC